MTLQELNTKLRAIKKLNSKNLMWAKRRMRINLAIEMGILGEEYIEVICGEYYDRKIPTESRELGSLEMEKHIGHLLKTKGKLGEDIDLDCMCGRITEVGIQVNDFDECIQAYCPECNYTVQIDL